MEEIKQHCEKIIQMLHSDYKTQLHYSGIIKKYMMLCYRLCLAIMSMNSLIFIGTV